MELEEIFEKREVEMTYEDWLNDIPPYPKG